MDNFGERVARLISGGAYAVVTAIENASPQIVMEESIREVGVAITEIRKELGLAVVRKKNIQDTIKSDKEIHTTLLEQIKSALNEGRDDLAEAGAGKQIDIEAQLSVLEGQLKDVVAEEKKYEEYITALQAKKREMEESLESYKKNSKEVKTQSGVEDAVSKADEAFNRVGGNTSDVVVPSEDEAKLDELAELDRKAKIKSRIAGLKQVTGE